MEHPVVGVGPWSPRDISLQHIHSKSRFIHVRVTPFKHTKNVLVNRPRRFDRATRAMAVRLIGELGVKHASAKARPLLLQGEKEVTRGVNIVGRTIAPPVAFDNPCIWVGGEPLSHPRRINFRKAPMYAGTPIACIVGR